MQLTYYEFAKEELDQLGGGASATTSFTSSSSDTQDSSPPTTGLTTPQDRDSPRPHAENQEDYAQQQQHGEGVGEGEGMPSGARHYTVHRDSQQEPGGEETSGARQYRYSLQCVCRVAGLCLWPQSHWWSVLVWLAAVVLSQDCALFLATHRLCL